MHCPGGNATDPIWTVLATSQGISSWTPLKPQHSNPNPKPLVNYLWSIDYLTPLTPLIIPHRLPAFLESFMPLNNWCLIHVRCSKSSLKHSIRFCGIFFFKFKTEFYCISFFKSVLTSRLHIWNWCGSCSLVLLNRRPRAHSSGPKGPKAWCDFPYHISSISVRSLTQLPTVPATANCHWLVELNWII